MKKSKEIVVIPTDLPIGQLFRFEGSDTVYVVRKAKTSYVTPDSMSIGSCEGCVWEGNGCCPKSFIACDGTAREDDTPVVFKEKKEKK